MGESKAKRRKALSTSAVARHMGVTGASVANWIDQGLLKAGRTPGGHRRVEVRDLREFLTRQKLAIPPELDGRASRILVVDDEPAVRKWIVQELRERRPDVELLEAGDGFSAGELVATWKPDVVLLDLRMAGLDGHQVCRRIKANQATRHIEVIAVTALGTPGDRKRILAAGARACLGKPLDMEALLRELDAVLGK
jgi:CheY-like chemotaxis protein